MERLSMFHNGTNCDVYIGTGAGKQLMENIKAANKSVKVISPYISPRLIEELIDLQDKGVKIEVITSKEGYYQTNTVQNESIKQFIKQEQIINKEAKKKRDRWLRIVKLLSPFTLSYTIALILLYCIFIRFGGISLFLFIPSIIFAIIILRGRQIVQKTRIYSYEYLKRLNFKIYIRDNYNTFIHSKIYIIDNEKAYLGSLNYTHSGTKHSLETRIKLTEPQVIEEVDTFFYQLWNNKLNLYEYTSYDIARDFYKEPIN